MGIGGLAERGVDKPGAMERGLSDSAEGVSLGVLVCCKLAFSSLLDEVQSGFCLLIKWLLYLHWS